MKTLSIILLLINFHLCPGESEKDSIPHFEWMEQVGAQSFPTSDKVFNVKNYGAVGDAIQMNTTAIQKAIDDAVTSGGGIVTFEPGIYLTGSLFIGDNINFHIPKGTMLIGSQNLNDYKQIDTRVAGLEMKWPAALVNIIGKKNAAITGNGTIHGKGKVFWDKYWDMRREYEPKGLRWIVDYDCERPRGILISDSEDITVDGVVLYQPGFWSLHILYSSHVSVRNMIISNNIEGHGPSTDGIDIDSSSFILVENSTINCNDDNFCLKAGRDADGLKVNRPCEYIVIRECYAGIGAGLITCGSETSGSIRNVVAYNLRAENTTYGLRFKSAMNRGGTVEDIYLSNIDMKGVNFPISVDLNWNPTYSYSTLPEGYSVDEVPEHWIKMLEKVDPKEGTPKFKNIVFNDLTANDAEVCIRIGGIESSTIDNFIFKNVSLEGKKSGFIKYANNWDCESLSINGLDEIKLENNKKVKLQFNELVDQSTTK
ncbi:glycoside hydrolase family 28 protein [Carboxylicivirga caseinilyticus]|uniref:glycoside hydrolase family 28 protein n=1 Tax=Carboxylicivirga caseinilyticus TaxID=3417572 RepID=UPI003D345365|nr:right-handed parallel beta-helix repeat-containing protein [Marinilabiliaceae bacterium A049]